MEWNTTEDADNGSVSQSMALTAHQLRNSAGGFVYKVDDINRLRRFLCLGSEGGTYYMGEKELGVENAACIKDMISKGKGKDVVNEITEFSVQGRAAKQNPIIFALAMCARQEEDKTVQRAAYESLPKVCRIPTHLFSFVEYSEQLSKGTGWGRAQRRAISNWYLNHRDNPMRLAMHVTKYRNRNGWTHRDILRLSHPKPDNSRIALILKYVIKGIKDASATDDQKDESLLEILNFLKSTEDVKTESDDEKIVDMIKKFNLVREHIPTNKLQSVKIWHALLEDMPMTAMIRNLAKMTVIGLIAEDSESTKLIMKRLQNEQMLKKAKIHPFNILTALNTYKKGKGEKGKLTWKPVNSICLALNGAFYKSFKFVEPTELRHCIALDVSGSMSCGGVIGNNAITAREGSAAMSMVTARTEKNHEFVGFSNNIVNLHIKKDMSLEKVIEVIEAVPMGGTDCAQPMLWAKKHKKAFDVFIIYTDCETWAGAIHPSEALREYRKASGIWDAKLIVCAMTANKFTLADPEDPGMFDMPGFDSAAPEVIRNFSLGLL